MYRPSVEDEEEDGEAELPIHSGEPVGSSAEYETRETYIESCNTCSQDGNGLSLMVRVPDLSLEPGEMDWYCPKCNRRE